MNHHDLLFTSSPEALARGIASDGLDYVCLICGRRFETGAVYPMDDRLFTAERAACEHVAKEHGGAFGFLLNLDKRLNGLTDQQKRILDMMYHGCSDDEIARTLKLTSSTVRNHRFYLREKEKQARMFLAIMSLGETEVTPGDQIVDPHLTATMVDERYAVTEAEKAAILKRYLQPDGSLESFPLKEKKRLVLLREIARRFDPERRYTEFEVNDLLRPVYNDHVLIRRNLIEYGLLDRLPDGSAYWVKTEL